jgi:colanic acid/amylovoran biosynthesis glycosyltransferase
MIHYITTTGIGNPWISLELGVLKREGIPFELHAMRLPDSVFYSSDWARDLNESTRSIYPCPWVQFALSMFLAPFLFRSRFFACFWNAFTGKRESPRARIAGVAHLLAACHWARMIRHEDVSHIHAQWAHSCATIGMYGAWLLNKTFSFTGHGADIWRDRCALEDKIKRSLFIACISEFHRRLYLENGAQPEQLTIVYCGINPDLFFPKELAFDADQPLRIRSSGRLVEKKGYEYLIDACKILVDEGVNVECSIVGNGPLAAALRERVRRHGIESSVRVPGKSIKYEEMAAFLHEGDIYCLPCVWSSDDDADGLPAGLFEAMASGLPAISTRLVGIPDLITDGVNGLLVPPRDAKALADALRRLHEDHGLARTLAHAGLKTVHEKFNLATCVDPLIKHYKALLKTSSDNCPKSSEKYQIHVA